LSASPQSVKTAGSSLYTPFLHYSETMSVIKDSVLFIKHIFSEAALDYLRIFCDDLMTGFGGGIDETARYPI
jgi:hypothetical protein